MTTGIKKKEKHLLTELWMCEKPAMQDLREICFCFICLFYFIYCDVFLQPGAKTRTSDLYSASDLFPTLSFLPRSSLLELFFLCLLLELLLSSISPACRLCPGARGAGRWTFLLLFLSVSSRLLFGALWRSEDENLVRTELFVGVWSLVTAGSSGDFRSVL